VGTTDDYTNINRIQHTSVAMARKKSELCMDNTLKNDFFGFPKVKRLQYTGDVGKCTSC